MKNQELDFESMGIYDLRNYARSIGVVSPTKFRRDELIAKITAIIMGEEPEEKKTNKGRPPKHKINDQSKLDFILPNNMFDNCDPKYQAYKNQTSLKYGVLDLMCENTNTATTNILYDGYYKPFDINYGFILKKGYLSNYYKENVIILNDLAEQYNLAEGDYVTGASSYLKNKNLMLATSILTINNKQSIVKGERVVFDNSILKKPTEKIILDSDGLIDFKIIDKLFPLVKGTRILLNFDDKDQTKNTVTSMLKNLTKLNNIKPFLFTIDDLPEEIYDIYQKCPEIQLVNYGCGMERQNYIEMTNLMVKNCERLVQEGKDVAIVVYNTENYKNNLISNAIITDGLDESRAVVCAQNKIKDLFGMARNCEHGSLTTIMINSRDDELIDICNTNIKFNTSTLPQTDITCDVFKSFTRNLQDLLSENEFQQVKCFKSNLTKENMLNKLNKLFDDVK